jgi:RHS repeat-associated protein
MHPGISHGYGEVASVRYNGFNQLLSVNSTDGSTTAFAYDGNGNQVGKTDSSGLTQYVYDLDNRLRGIALPGGGSNAFEYDANGLRTKKMDSSGTRSFLLDGLSVVAEYQSGSRSAFYSQSLARIDEVLSVVNGSGKFWYESDALGSTYALTSRGGAAVARTGYDVFGASARGSGTVDQAFGFSGADAARDAGLLYRRDRYVDPAIAHWTQPDRWRFADGYSVYGYGRNNPATRVDPMGHLSGPVIGALRLVAAAEGVILIGQGIYYILEGVRQGRIEFDAAAAVYIGMGAYLVGVGMTLLALAAVTSCEQEEAVIQEIIEEAESTVGNGPGLGAAREVDQSLAVRVGEEWVGEGARTASNPLVRISGDSLRQFRIAYKPTLGRWQLNLEWRALPKGRFIGNFHVDVVFPGGMPVWPL